MSKDAVVRRLRPYLFSAFKRSRNFIPARAFISTPYLHAHGKEHDVTHDYEKRVDQLQAYKSLPDCYPRLEQHNVRDHAGKRSFETQYEHLQREETMTDGPKTRIRGTRCGC